MAAAGGNAQAITNPPGISSWLLTYKWLAFYQIWAHSKCCLPRIPRQPGHHGTTWPRLFSLSLAQTRRSGGLAARSSLGACSNQNMPSIGITGGGHLSPGHYLDLHICHTVPPPLVPQVLVSTSSASLHRSINISLTFIRVFLEFWRNEYVEYGNSIQGGKVDTLEPN